MMKKTENAKAAIIDQASDREKSVMDAMARGDLRAAARYAEEHALLRHGYRGQKETDEDEPIPAITSPYLSVQKLKHDIDQFRHLKARGIKIRGLDTIIRNYTKVMHRLEPLGNAARMPFEKTDIQLIGRHYNRILYRPETPRVRRALSGEWQVATAENGVSAEKDYLSHPYGLTVIDNFLTEKALQSLRKFCLESTIWFENRYSYGRLGAFFREGFNCPLLVQIGEEIRDAFPRIIGEKHRLLQIWGFKCDHFQPVTAPHADFAAINVNFWITPEEANLDPDSGGMVIYDVEAPLSWDFNSYNNQGDKISALLKKKKARGIVIPYKANRAIIFNSDMFHATSPVRFRDEYDARRINVTMLYGKREDAGKR